MHPGLLQWQLDFVLLANESGKATFEQIEAARLLFDSFLVVLFKDNFAVDLYCIVILIFGWRILTFIVLLV